MLPEDIFLKAIEASRDGMIITEERGKDNIIIYANKAFERLTGYSQEEILGRDCRFLQGHSGMPSPESALIRAALDSHESILTTLKNYRKDGTEFWNELTLSPIKDSDGKVTHYIGVQKDVTDRIKLREENLHLEKEIKIDSLTGLYNRNVIANEAMMLWESTKRYDGYIGVLFLDTDNFKTINDTYGHDAGDQCLKHLANILTKYCERNTDIVLRYGGEEFVIISPGDSAQASMLAKELLAAVADDGVPMEVAGGEKINLTVSIGVVVAKPTACQSLWQLIVAADKAMYKAKRDGRNLIVVGDL